MAVLAKRGLFCSGVTGQGSTLFHSETNGRRTAYENTNMGFQVVNPFDAEHCVDIKKGIPMKKLLRQMLISTDCEDEELLILAKIAENGTTTLMSACVST